MGSDPRRDPGAVPRFVKVTYDHEFPHSCKHDASIDIVRPAVNSSNIFTNSSFNPALIRVIISFWIMKTCTCRTHRPGKRSVMTRRRIYEADFMERKWDPRLSGKGV